MIRNELIEKNARQNHQKLGSNQQNKNDRLQFMIKVGYQVQAKRLDLYNSYQQMQTNKINQRIQLQQEQFQYFIQHIRQQHSSRNKQSSNNILELSHNHIHNQRDSFTTDFNVQSLGSKSLYLSRPQSTQITNNKHAGDKTLKMRGKFGVANRLTIKKHQLPSQYFTPLKSKLEQHLRNSRLVPNVELLPNIKMDSTSKKYLFSQDQMSMLSESKVLRGQTNTTKLSQVNPSIALKYCFIHQLSEASDVKEILLFFVRLLQMLGYSLPEPIIEKYKDCIYFGPGIRKRQITQGLLYFYRGSLYIGDLLEYSMHGRGIQIFFHIPAIFQGDFKQGTMHGYFQVTKDYEKYCGMVENGVYQGHGKLVTRKGIVEGQFRQGKIVSVSKNVKQASIVKNNCNFRVREALERNSVQEYIQTSKWFDDLSTNHSWMLNREVQPKKQPQMLQSSSKGRNSKNKIEDSKQFSDSYSSQMIQQGTQQYYHNNSRFNRNNPEITVNKDKSYHTKLRSNGHLTKSIQTIRQETELAQQQPLQSKT